MDSKQIDQLKNAILNSRIITARFVALHKNLRDAGLLYGSCCELAADAVASASELRNGLQAKLQPHCEHKFFPNNSGEYICGDCGLTATESALSATAKSEVAK